MAIVVLAVKNRPVFQADSICGRPDNHLLLSNRSHALYRLNRFQAALVDAEMVVRLRPNWGKGHYRRGVALSGLGRHEEALVAFSLCVALDRNPGALKLEMARTLHRLLVGPSSFRARCHSLCVPAPYSLEARLHRGARFLTASHPSLNSSDCEDNSTDFDEDCMQLGMQHLSPNSNSQLQENTKFHNLLDHISQEVEKIINLDLKPLDLPVGSLKGDQGDFDCVLCCRMLWRPVTTPCGHTYCWMCLDRCLDYSFACPLCMTSLAEYLTNAQKSITEFVDRAMRMTMPNEYRSRQLLHCQEVSELLLSDQERQPEIPVFVCTTAFPGVPCPLFVYEPRYRVMVRRCVEAGTTQFGIAACLNKEGGPKRYAEFGTMLEIRDWVLLSDGCSILTTVGARRFRALARGERDGYDTAQVEFLRDQPVPQEHIHDFVAYCFLGRVKELHERVRHKGRLWFGSILPPVQAEIVRTFGSMPNVEDDWLGLMDGPSWTWWLLAILPLGQNLQVSILGTTSLEKRLRAIDKTLDYIQQRLVHTGSQTCSSKDQDASPASLSSLNLFSSRDPSQQATSSRQEQGFTSPRTTNTGTRRILQRGSRFSNQIVLHPEQSVGARLFAEESS
uniref:LON peptidase N-terminal domain and RING finger protein 3 n=1 Tax=Timema cristinae TaxID=61476 RepID=A0A7R9CQF9_TIMCR|nr:unnamed protein product [Timema cristinae]